MHPVKYGDHHLQQHLLMDDVDGSCSSSSVFFISNPPHQHHQQQQPFVYSLHSQQQIQHQNVFQQHTHQLFQHHHQFQPFQQQAAEPVHHHQNHVQYPQPFVAVNFKLGLHENSGNKEAALALFHQQNDATFLHGNKRQVLEISGPQQHSLLMPHCLQPQEDSPIKEPFWKPLNRREYRQCSGDGAREIEGNKYKKVLQQPGQCTSERSKNLDDKYRLFGELEAIYGVPKGVETTQAGSGSALTGENSRPNVGLSVPLSEFQGHHLCADGGAGNVATGVDHGSETSIEKEASLRKIQKKKRKNKMSSMAVFFQSLVKQVSDHQEGLHRRLLEEIERMDIERSKKEESWRQQEAEKRNREAIARANEQALASSREAVIVSYLEKITGQSINLPARPPLSPQPDSAIEPVNNESISVKVDNNNSRWPRAEVEALVQTRCNLESKFQEPGSKGPLWEEVSSSMASLGYNRSAKRCKEKWENINNYFRKSKADGKKRSKQSKTCPYFDQLDHLYSRIPITCPTSPTPLMNTDRIEMQQQGHSDFLDAYMSQRDLGTAQANASENLKVSK